MSRADFEPECSDCGRLQDQFGVCWKCGPVGMIKTRVLESAVAVAAEQLEGGTGTARTTIYGDETVFEGMRPMFDGETIGIQIIVDHGEASDPEALARGDGPLHLKVRGCLEDIEAECIEDVDGSDGTVTVCLSLQASERFLAALTKALALAQRLALSADQEGSGDEE